jgi:hypothetical protein
MRKRRNMKYNIEFEDRELQFVLDCIAEKPFKIVKPLMDKLETQIKGQQDPLERITYKTIGEADKVQEKPLEHEPDGFKVEDLETDDWFILYKDKMHIRKDGKTISAVPTKHEINQQDNYAELFIQYISGGKIGSVVYFVSYKDIDKVDKILTKKYEDKV